MWLLRCEYVILLASVFLVTVNSQYKVPTPVIDIYKPAGFKVSIPDLPGIEQVNFNMNKNKAISRTGTGQFVGEVTEAKDGLWTFEDSDAKFVAGDRLHYWIFVQYHRLGYYKEGIYEIGDVTEACRETATVVTGKTDVCSKNVLFEDDFENLDTSKWLINHYIPYESPDGEFVSYQNDDTVCYTKEGKLFIKPTLQNDVFGTLNLTDGCTKNSIPECFMEYELVFILPPVISGRLTSKFEFMYGRVEIRAKLPAGDWIFPEVYLESSSDPSRKLVIAYSRGNLKFTDSTGDDYGGKLLLGGPMFSNYEPERSRYLASKKSTVPFSDDFHVFSVSWTADNIKLHIDGSEFGTLENTFRHKTKLVLGVGVGGLNDFPDDYTSGDVAKPWANGKRDGVYNFYHDKTNWYSTWHGDSSALQVEYVRIWAL